MGSPQSSRESKTVIVVFDSLETTQVRPEAVGYGLELARRTASSLAVLLLLPHAAAPMDGSRNLGEVERDAETMIAELVEADAGEDLPVATALKLGDPSSELLKYLAGVGTVTTIVWGGRELPSRGRDHWLVRIRDSLGVPVVVPSLKRTTQTPRHDAPVRVPDKERP